MKFLYPLLFLISLSIHANEGNQYQLFQASLSIVLDNDLLPMSESTLNKRFGHQNVPPAYAFSNKEQDVSITFTQYPTPANKQNMKKIHRSLSAMLRKANSSAKWKKDKVYTRLGTKIAVFEYEEASIGKYQYNLTYALPINEQLTFISFITTEKKYKQKWLTLVRESFDSMQLTSL